MDWPTTKDEPPERPSWPLGDKILAALVALGFLGLIAITWAGHR